jgi:membrane protease YdiL (CAAX protease family)
VTPVVAGGLVVAAVAWGALFAPGKDGFWGRAAVAGTVIGAYGLAAQRAHLDRLLRVSAGDVLLGVVAAVVLYCVFWVGDRLLQRVVPTVGRQTGELYAITSSGRRGTVWISLVLVLVGACEELFWRGFVQDRAGVAVALVAYAAVHLWERKAALVLAAAVAGAAWSALFAWRGNLTANLVSHALWDLAAVVWFPLRRPD